MLDLFHNCFQSGWVSDKKSTRPEYVPAVLSIQSPIDIVVSENRVGVKPHTCIAPINANNLTPLSLDLER